MVKTFSVYLHTYHKKIIFVQRFLNACSELTTIWMTMLKLAHVFTDITALNDKTRTYKLSQWFFLWQLHGRQLQEHELTAHPACVQQTTKMLLQLFFTNSTALCQFKEKVIRQKWIFSHNNVGDRSSSLQINSNILNFVMSLYTYLMYNHMYA